MSSDDLESRLERLEIRQELLRDFAVRGVWNALERLYARTGVRSNVSCLACGETRKVEAFARRVDRCMFGGGRLERLECPACGCVFGPLAALEADADWIASDYRLLYAAYSEGDSTEAEIRTFEALRPDRAGVYLNWGAGAWSDSVAQLRARGYDVWGYEPNAAAPRDFIVGSREEVSARFDGVFSNNVIEHFIDPAGQFADLRTLLKPGGRMAHASPCFEWSYAFTRFHVFFPLARSAEALAHRTGFDLTDRIEDGEYQARVFQVGD
ncbi:MAG: hypothetical protein JWO72_536 [Caulobacteraceae bacterium]|nr:hypothetical protein [Caulobacteraceae bacterium]